MNVVLDGIVYGFARLVRSPVVPAIMVPVMQKAHHRRAGYQTRAAEVGLEPWRSILSLPRVPQHLSTRPQSVTVITVIVCILWGFVPQVQELATSLIVLNALWLARAAVRSAGQTSACGLVVQQRNTATPVTGIVP